jgi:hypothetical protein
VDRKHSSSNWSFINSDREILAVDRTGDFYFGKKKKSALVCRSFSAITSRGDRFSKARKTVELLSLLNFETKSLNRNGDGLSFNSAIISL